MRLTGRIAVEQLDEERLTNIERQIVLGAAERLAQPTREPRHYFAFATTALCAVAAGVVGWQLHRAPVTAPAAPQTIAVATDAQRASLALDGAELAAQRGASYRVARSDGKVEIDLDRGKLDLAVEHRPGRVLLVHAGDTDIEDVGTKFSVDYDGAGRVDVRVTEGQVKVTRHQRSALVAAGGAWTTSQGAVAVAAVVPQNAAAPGAAAQASGEPIVSDPQPEARHAATATSRAATGSATPARPTTSKPAPRDDLRARIDSHAPDRDVDHTATLDEFAMKANRAGDLGDKSQWLYGWAYALYTARKFDEADRLLEGVVHKSAGSDYQAALWMRLRIRCRGELDAACRAVAHDYEAANGPLSAIAHEILVATE